MSYADLPRPPRDVLSEDGIEGIIDLAKWKSTVMGVPQGWRVLVTSDHAYAFLGAGSSFSAHRDDRLPFSPWVGGQRYAGGSRG